MGLKRAHCLVSGGLNLDGNGLLNGRGGILNRGNGLLNGLNVRHLGRGGSVGSRGLETTSGRRPLGLVLLLSETFIVVTLQGEQLLEVGLCTHMDTYTHRNGNEGGSAL